MRSELMKFERVSVGGFVYLCKFQNPENITEYKIGMTRDISQRMGSLQYLKSHTGTILHLLCAGYTESPADAELNVQHELSDFRIYGEYFNFHETELMHVISVIRKNTSLCYTYLEQRGIDNFIRFSTRLLPEYNVDAGAWETTPWECQYRDVCIEDRCSSYKLCNEDRTYWNRIPVFRNPNES
jgi:hypothetical protein